MTNARQNAIDQSLASSQDSQVMIADDTALCIVCAETLPYCLGEALRPLSHAYIESNAYLMTVLDWYASELQLELIDEDILETSLAFLDFLGKGRLYLIACLSPTACLNALRFPGVIQYNATALSIISAYELEPKAHRQIADACASLVDKFEIGRNAQGVIIASVVNSGDLQPAVR
jgi:hypothetical protein